VGIGFQGWERKKKGATHYRVALHKSSSNVISWADLRESGNENRQDKGIALQVGPTPG